MRWMVGFLWLCLVTPVLGQTNNGISFNEETHDFGNLAETNGPAVFDFILTNKSPRPVRILSVTPSCGCTTPSWTQEAIPPGKTGYIRASFNPLGRPGYFHKNLSVITDHNPSAQVILNITGTVIPEGGPLPSDFQAINGSWRLRASSFNMGKVFKDKEPTIRDFTIYQTGDQPVSLIGKIVSPPYIVAELIPKILKKGEKGTLRLIYHGAQRPGYGFQSDNIELTTDDPVLPVKSFSVFATLEDKPVTVEAGKNPVIGVQTLQLDFGNLKVNQSTTRELTVTNPGKAILQLKAIQPNCTCVEAEAVKTELKPGESTVIRIKFTAMDRRSTQVKSLAIYSNDPITPVQRIALQGRVTE